MNSFRAVVAGADAVIYHDHHVCQCDTGENMSLVSTRRLSVMLNTERVARRHIWSKKISSGRGAYSEGPKRTWTSFQFEFE